MKRGLFLILAVLAMAGAVWAGGPYIQADPQPDAERYRIRLSVDGATWGEWKEAPPISGAMKYDVSTTTPGVYQGQAQAGASTTLTDKVSNSTTSVFLWSTDAPFVLKVPSIGPPKNLRIITAD